MIFRPKVGAMWDPSVLWHNGKYYAFMIYEKYDRIPSSGLGTGHCLLATSTDGVHWDDQGDIINERERPDAATFCKCFVAKCGDKFIMNHGLARLAHDVAGQPIMAGQPIQDMMRFYQSQDLRHWQHIGITEADGRWYLRDRWDHMYILPKEEGNPEAGYWGYIVAIAKEQNNLPAMMESRDGIKWKALPPSRTEWGSTPPRNYLEYGGCERIGRKYYLIGGTHGYAGNACYSMFTFVADNPRGPFRPDAGAFRLCGNSGKTVAWLACWVRGRDELLISNYASMQPGDMMAPWMLPLRKPLVGKDGHLRLGWWKGNEVLKGDRLAVGKKKVVLSGAGKPGNYDVLYLDELGRSSKGIVLEGKLKARAFAGGDIKPAVGFVIEEKLGQAMAVQMGIGKPEGRETHIGRFVYAADGSNTFMSEDVTGKGCATVTGVENGREHAFRLLCRMEMFELYVDDLLMQTHTRQPGSGRVGFIVCNAMAEFSNLRAWAMDAWQRTLPRDPLDKFVSVLEKALWGLPSDKELQSWQPARSVTTDRAVRQVIDVLMRLQKGLPVTHRRAARTLALRPRSVKVARLRELLKRVEERGLADEKYTRTLAGVLKKALNDPSLPLVVTKFKAGVLQAPVADIAPVLPPRPGLARKVVPLMQELANVRGFHGGADGILYIEATVGLDRPYRGALAYGADGPVKVWVNGRAADCRPQATNPALAGEYVTPVSWQKGVNRITFALATNGGSACGVQARVLRNRKRR